MQVTQMGGMFIFSVKFSREDCTRTPLICFSILKSSDEASSSLVITFQESSLCHCENTTFGFPLTVGKDRQVLREAHKSS